MIASSNDVAATLSFSSAHRPDFWSLAGTLVWCLRQADIRIYRQDLAFDGDSMTFETDHGRIRIDADSKRRAARKLTIGASARLEGSRDVARQVCYQLSQRIMARYDVVNVFWKPTLQNFAPANFKWSGLRDMPAHMNVTLQRAGLFGQRASLV